MLTSREVLQEPNLQRKQTALFSRKDRMLPKAGIRQKTTELPMNTHVFPTNPFGGFAIRAVLSGKVQFATEQTETAVPLVPTNHFTEE